MAYIGRINATGAIRLTDAGVKMTVARMSSERIALQAACDWRFQIGQCVSHVSQNMPSLIMGRLRASNGLEFYGARSFSSNDSNRDRLMCGDSLVDVMPGSQPCSDCLLYKTGMCPAV